MSFWHDVSKWLPYVGTAAGAGIGALAGNPLAGAAIGGAGGSALGHAIDPGSPAAQQAAAARSGVLDYLMKMGPPQQRQAPQLAGVPNWAMQTPMPGPGTVMMTPDGPMYGPMPVGAYRPPGAPVPGLNAPGGMVGNGDGGPAGRRPFSPDVGYPQNGFEKKEMMATNNPNPGEIMLSPSLQNKMDQLNLQDLINGYTGGIPYGIT